MHTTLRPNAAGTSHPQLHQTLLLVDIFAVWDLKMRTDRAVPGVGAVDLHDLRLQRVERVDAGGGRLVQRTPLAQVALQAEHRV